MRSVLAAGFLTLLAVSPISSHDFWLVPDAFQVAANAELGVNVRALYILPAPADSGADWDVHWATFVWEASAR